MSARPTQKFVKGQTIVLEGSQGDRSYRILSGEVVVCKQNSHDDLVPMAKLGPGDIFGEMYLFDGMQARTATVIAASSDVVVEIYFQDEMQNLIGQMHPSMRWMMQGFSTRLRAASTTCVELHKQARYARLPDGTMRQSGTSIRRTQQ